MINSAVAAAKYDSSGQKIGQTASYFSWWMAIDESEGTSRGVLMDYASVASSSGIGEKVHIIGEAKGTGRIINDRLETTYSPNGTVGVILEDGQTEVYLYPNIQITPRAEVIKNYWFTDQETGENLTFEEADPEGQAEQGLVIHGQLTDDRETSVLVSRTINFNNRNDGTLLAVGAGQRYILRQPAPKSVVQAWETKKRTQSAAS